MKKLYWLGSSLEDLRALPASARSEAGLDLYLVQSGLLPRDWRSMPLVGPGVREIRNRTPEGAFRVLYVVESDVEVFVLHAFQKKTEKTARVDIEKAQVRYRLIP